MQFENELNLVLPAGLPNRDSVISNASAHLEMIVEANRQFNLTRITGAREAAIKHVLDSVIPWPLFAHARHVLDAGTGAGFPGIPLAVALPDTRFTLAESIQKKARFVASVLETLGLPNVSAAAKRAEELHDGGFDIITARAVAPIPRALELFAAALRTGTKMLLYKGPDAEREIADAAPIAKKLRVRLRVALRYDLPDAMGTRTVVEIDQL